MKKETAHIQILKACRIEGKPYKVGAIAECRSKDAAFVASIGKAKIVDAPTQKPKPKLKKEAKNESD